jgi:hypothetical protein
LYSFPYVTTHTNEVCIEKSSEALLHYWMGIMSGIYHVGFGKLGNHVSEIIIDERVDVLLTCIL